MKKRFLIAAFVVATGGFFAVQSAFAQIDLQALGDDFTTLLGAVGNQIEPDARNGAVFGMGMGQAEIGNFPSFSLSLTAGAVLSDGLFGFVDNTSFSLLNVKNLFDTLLGGSSTSGIYNTLQTFFPYPITRISVAFGTVHGIEGLVQFSIWPQVLTDAIVGLALPSAKGDITFNTLNIGGEIRKVLISDSGGFPAISIGAKYDYSAFAVGYNLGSLSLDLGGTNVGLAGNLSIANSINSIGLGIMASKRLGVLTVYTGVTGWEQLTRYDATVKNFDATISSGGSTTHYAGDDPAALQTNATFSTMANAGLELRFGGFVMFAHGQFDIAQLLPSATVGLRFHF